MKNDILKTWTEYFSKDASLLFDSKTFKVWIKKEAALNISWLKLFDVQLITLSEDYFEKIKNNIENETSVEKFKIL